MGTSDELGISNNYELGGGEKKVEVVKRLEASRFVGWLKKTEKEKLVVGEVLSYELRAGPKCKRL